MAGKVQNPTDEQVQAALAESVGSFENLDGLNNFLVKLHPSDAYKVIRDHVKPQSNMLVRTAKINHVEWYQRFQEIQKEAKRIFDYERKTATIFGVQEITKQTVQQYYGIAVRMIGKVDDELGRVEAAINRIEEHIGMSVTKFEDGDGNDTTKSGNEQGVKEVADGTGSTGTAE
ncbi:MAG: hypothetical protein NC247_02095 [Ruminococcus flavefaciens]|nr:hypothetical protein [Ruminococcus flavefaciens]